jgi:glycosidase
MYQVNIRAFSSSHNLAGVTARLDQIKSLGTNVIYLMPVYPVGTVRSVNSPYCIKDFQSVGTEYGSLTDLRNLVDGAHSRGMAVILD